MPTDRDEGICIVCGRRGTRGFNIISGKAGEPATQLICSNRAACAKRERAAIKHEARRGNWS